MPIREIGASITMNASQFKEEMGAVNRNLAGLQSEMKAVTAEFSENGNSAEALAAKQKILDQAEAQQAEKVRALTKAYAEQAKATGENSAKADALRKQLNNARADYAKASQAADDNRKALTGARTATAAMGTLAVAGLSKLVDFAKEAATAVDADGNLINQRFSTLAENMTSLDAGASAAKAALGGLLLPALESISGAGAELLNGFAKDLESVSGDTQAMAGVCKKYLLQAANVIRDELPGLVSLGSDILEALMEGLEVAGPYLLDTAGDLIQMLLDGLTEHAGDIVVDNAPQLLTAGITLITSLINGISSDLPALIPVAVDAVTQLLSALVENAPQLLVAGATLILQLVNGLITHIPDLIAAIPKLISDFIHGFDGNLDGLADIGSQIVEKILAGLKAAWTGLTSWFSDAIARLTNGHVTVGGSHAGGLNYVPYDNYPAILHRGERVLTAAENASGAYGNGGGSTVNITVNTRELSRSQADYLIRRADAELGKGV